MHTTAAQLWETWIQAGVIRPKDYDEDLAQAVLRHLPSTGPADLVAAMTTAEWTPRDLLHALEPELAIFSAMLQDLLRLYEKVGARSATGDNLRISYEFDDDDPLDVLLSSFREEEHTARRVARSASEGGFTFNLDHAFENPARNLGSWQLIETLFDGQPLEEWPFALGAPKAYPTWDERADDIVRRGLAIVQGTLDVLSGLGDTTAESTAWLRAHSDARGTLDGDIAQAATDFWPMFTTATLHALGDAFRDGSAGGQLLDEMEVWLDGFASDATVEALIADITDLLSLPSWGKRHELYSAWIASQIDEALTTDRAEFRVVDATLRFPFAATLLADITTAGGRHELWCEMRTDLIDPVSGERLRGIQPDYRVLRREADGTGTTVLAIEVKQYLRSASGRHGKVLAMYAAGLPEATVLLVGHGPLGGTVRNRVSGTDQSRIGIFEHVRPGQPHTAAAFRSIVTTLLPPPPSKMPRQIALRWDPAVRDLDLHVCIATGETLSWKHVHTADGVLLADARDGGPEVVDLGPEARPPAEVSVHLYSSATSSVVQANPVITVTWSDGSTQHLRPRGHVEDDRWWRVCRFDTRGLVPSAETTTT